MKELSLYSDASVAHHGCTVASFDVRMLEAAEKLGIKTWTEQPN